METRDRTPDYSTIHISAQWEVRTTALYHNGMGKSYALQCQTPPKPVGRVCHGHILPGAMHTNSILRRKDTI